MQHSVYDRRYDTRAPINQPASQPDTRTFRLCFAFGNLLFTRRTIRPDPSALRRHRLGSARLDSTDDDSCVYLHFIKCSNIAVACYRVYLGVQRARDGAEQ